VSGLRGRVRVGEALVREGALSEEQLSRALAEQKSSGQRLGEMLVDQGLISSTTLVTALANTLGVRGCQLRHGLMDPQLLGLIGADEAERLRLRLAGEGVEVRAIRVETPLPEKQRYLVGSQKVVKIDQVQPIVLDAQQQERFAGLAAESAGDEIGRASCRERV